MSSELLKVFPEDVVSLIKIYTGETRVRNEKYMKQLSKYDLRYAMLKKRPQIKQVKCDVVHPTTYGSVWFKIKNAKFVVISVIRVKLPFTLNEKDVWKMQYDRKEHILDLL